jgi:hypothetical protein
MRVLVTFHPYAMEVSPVEPPRISTPAPGDSPGAKGVDAAGQIPAPQPAGHPVTRHPAVPTDRWGR